MINSKKGQGRQVIWFEGRIADPFKFEPVEEDRIPNKAFVLAPLGIEWHLAQIIECRKLKHPELHDCKLEYYVHYYKKDWRLDAWVLESQIDQDFDEIQR